MTLSRKHIPAILLALSVGFWTSVEPALHAARLGRGELSLPEQLYARAAAEETAFKSLPFEERAPGDYPRVVDLYRQVTEASPDASLGDRARMRMADLTPGLLRRPLKRRIPVLTGLSATFLYREKRELDDGTEDDVRGEPVGHFVVLTGYDTVRRRVHVADPQPNPTAPTGTYPVDIDRVVASILLGVLTYDANLLVLEPKRERAARR